MNIAIGSDHRGVSLKTHFLKLLHEDGHTVQDFGCEEGVASCNYSDFAHEVAVAVADGDVSFGIVICGSGNGVAMCCNRHKGVRAALCWNEEVARLARKHGNANVLAVPASFLDEYTADRILQVFLQENFEGGRHQDRIADIEID
jgi:ribose 5-phosphate isomerase B